MHASLSLGSPAGVQEERENDAIRMETARQKTRLELLKENSYCARVRAIVPIGVRKIT